MLITIKFMRVIESKFSKIHPKIFSNRGSLVRCAGVGSAFQIICREHEITIKFAHDIIYAKKNLSVRFIPLYIWSLFFFLKKKKKYQVYR